MIILKSMKPTDYVSHIKHYVEQRIEYDEYIASDTLKYKLKMYLKTDDTSARRLLQHKVIPALQEYWDIVHDVAWNEYIFRLKQSPWVTETGEW